MAFENLPLFSYEDQNLQNWFFNPSTTHVEGTGLQFYFMRALFQRAMSVWKYRIPKEINPYYLRFNLWMRGYVGVGYIDNYGPVAQWGAPQGRDIYYYPKRLLVCNPAMEKRYQTILDPDNDGKSHEPSFIWEVGGKPEGCHILNLNGSFTGIWDTVTLYADMLSITLESWATNCKKAVAADFYGVKDQAQARAMKKATDLAHSGEMEIFIDKSLFNDDGSLNVATFQHNMPYLGTDLLNDFVTILHQFDTEIGIDNSNTQKRERMNAAEVYSNNEEIKSKIEMWLDDIQATCKLIKEDYGIDIWIEMRNRSEVSTNEQQL